MKKKGKKTALFSLLIFCLLASFLPSFPAEAAAEDKIYSIDIQARLQKDGSAIITEVWDVEIDSSSHSTEWYIPRGHLDGGVISDLSVSDESGKIYESLGRNWDVHASLEEKAAKCGLHDNEEIGGVEICWGIGSYGRHRFTVRYKMTQLVDGYQDGDVMYWRAVNDQLPSVPENIQLHIQAPFSISSANSKIWMYGNKGLIYFSKDKENGTGPFQSMSVQDLAASSEADSSSSPASAKKEGEAVSSSLREEEKGTIEARVKSDAFLSTNGHLTLFVAFQPGLFEAEKKYLNKSYQPLLEEANRGSDFAPAEEEKEEEDGPFDDLLALFWHMLLVFSILFPIFKTAGHKKDTLSYHPTRKEMDDTPYIRQPPFHGSLNANYAGLMIMDEIEDDRNLLSAYLLDWVYHGWVSFEEIEKKKLFGKKKVNCLRFLAAENPIPSSEGAESSLYDFFYKASKDGILEESELSSYMDSYYDDYFSITKSCYRAGKKELDREGVIEQQEKKALFSKKVITVVTEEGKGKLREILGFRHFLKDFTLVNEREATEVSMWDSYLIFAALFGMAEEVAKQFQMVNPNYFNGQSSFYGNDFWTNYYIISSFSDHTHSYAAKAQSSADASSFSGSGGFGSFGGGSSGFSGGGSGGGSR